MKTEVHYLDDKRWTEISREERFFCAELYFLLSRAHSMRTFITWLNQRTGNMSLPEDDQWDVGYEVCFYRDYIHAFGLNGTSSIRDKKVPGTEQAFLHKRTFDLALFHPEHLVIIEAKAQQGLDEKQLSTFSRDADDLTSLIGANGHRVPKVQLVLLAQKRIAEGARMLTGSMPFHGAITWGQLAEAAREWQADARCIAAFERAEKVS